LSRLRPQSVVILGGTAAISNAVATLLTKYTSGPVTRLAGADRYATAVAISVASYPMASSSVYLATGVDFPDALAGSVAAALAPAPLLLVPGSCVPPVVVSEIGRLNPASIVILGGEAAVGPAVSSLAPCAPAQTGCVFANGAPPAFCDTFGAPAGTGNRSGDLNGAVWGVSRLTGFQNFSSPANGWGTSSLNPCGEASTAAPHDVQVCNGEVHDSVNDEGNVTSLAMYPKQPFDFANRTGRIVFDVSNDSAGGHTTWPELWVTDQPVPTPFAHLGSLLSLPRNGFGVRFAACTNNLVCSPDGTSSGSVGVDSAIVVNNYVANDNAASGNLALNGLDSVSEPAPGQLNHYEVDVSQNQIDVYGTDAFVPGQARPPLKHLAVIPNAGLTFTRGLVWIEDAHYNANKICEFQPGYACQRNHTFSWGNFGFDGPVLPQDRAFDVPDNNAPSSAAAETDLGYYIGPSSSRNLSTLPVDSTSIAKATGALLTFGFFDTNEPIPLNISVNGHQLSVPWPYPDTTGYTDRTLGVPVPLADVQTGANTITFSTGASNAMNVMNVDLIMVGGGGVVMP
jgi:hypothetical protein